MAWLVNLSFKKLYKLVEIFRYAFYYDSIHRAAGPLIFLRYKCFPSFIFSIKVSCSLRIYAKETMKDILRFNIEHDNIFLLSFLN